jgi:hypothetical protein
VPQAAALTSGEKEMAANLLAGEHAPRLPTIEARPLLRLAILNAMNDLGITDRYLAEHIKGGLEATKLTQQGVDNDWGNRHKYLITTLEMLGVSGEPAHGEGSPQYRSTIRGTSDVIDVVPPKSVVARRRMNAAKPTNRKDS